MHEKRVGRHPIAFRKYDEITTHHLPTCNAFARAVADHQRTRAGQSRSASKTRSVRVSCTTVIKTDNVAKTSRIRASFKSPSAR